MIRYIDADALINILNAKADMAMGTPKEVFFSVAKMVELLPTKDVVEVVRCEDCKYCKDLGMSGLWCEHPDSRNPLGCRPNDYCNDGERRDDGT
jgi:hypothetical protein